ncbi:hypothetical protein ILYODFUR_025312 [Ilyodon furcidens]|uniref:Uncharacterized protein n=1 Tax=Ilyodon furcidens TaxID=33524 RepID=A0ABV0VH17_9TELE
MKLLKQPGILNTSEPQADRLHSTLLWLCCSGDADWYVNGSSNMRTTKTFNKLRKNREPSVTFQPEWHPFLYQSSLWELHPS